MTKTYGTYKDCNGNTCNLDEFHIHEILDRTHIIQNMFIDNIADHPASILFADDIEKIARNLGKLYQKIGGAR